MACKSVSMDEDIVDICDMKRRYEPEHGCSYINRPRLYPRVYIIDPSSGHSCFHCISGFNVSDKSSETAAKELYRFMTYTEPTHVPPRPRHRRQDSASQDHAELHPVHRHGWISPDDIDERMARFTLQQRRNNAHREGTIPLRAMRRLNELHELRRNITRALERATSRREGQNGESLPRTVDA